MLLADGWAKGEGKGGVKGLSSCVEVRVRVRGEYGFSSLVKQNKKAEICFVIYIAGFFLKKNSVMKCLRSKKRINGPDYTTAGTRTDQRRRLAIRRLHSVCVCVGVCVWSHACDNSYTRCTSKTSDRTSAGCDGGGAAQSFRTRRGGAEHGSVTIPVFR